MKVLFVCKHNRFRSKVAECIFNSLSKNPANEAESAGILMDIERPYIEKNVADIMKEKGYKISGVPRQLTHSLLNGFDLVIIVADNVEKEFFKDFKGKIIKWDVSDCAACEINSIKSIVDEIEENVNLLIKELTKM